MPLIDEPAFFYELAQAYCYDERVDGAVETTVTASLETVEEQHQLRYFQVTELSTDDEGKLLQRPSLQLVATSAVFRQVVQLRHRPRHRGVLAVGQPCVGQRRVVSIEALVLAGTYLTLVVRVELHQEGVTLTVLTDEHRPLRGDGQLRWLHQLPSVLLNYSVYSFH